MKTFIFIAIACSGLSVASTAMAEDFFAGTNLQGTYMTYCAECHGDPDKGDEMGPGLVKVTYLADSSADKIVKILTMGVTGEKKRFPESKYGADMPPFKEDLSKAEIKALAELIKKWNK